MPTGMLPGHNRHRELAARQAREDAYMQAALTGLLSRRLEESQSNASITRKAYLISKLAMHIVDNEGKLP